MKAIAIIQARMGASRLPGKVLMPLGESCVLDYVVSRCKAVEGLAAVVVATTRARRDDAVAAWCGENGAEVFRGSEEDVLSRFLEAAEPHAPDYVLRVTADNPFFDYLLASEMLKAALRESADLVAVEKGHPLGLAVELVRYDVLRRIGEIGREPRHREHVTYYAYEFPEQFRIVRIGVPEALRHPELRITVDTEEDYALCREVAAAFSGQKTVPTEEVVRYLLRHPETAAINRHVRQKPVV